MDDEVLVKFVKVDGVNLENPLPYFVYAVKVGTWEVNSQAEKHAEFFIARQGREVTVELGMQFGAMQGAGKVVVWQGGLADAPEFSARIKGVSPLKFME